MKNINLDENNIKILFENNKIILVKGNIYKKINDYRLYSNLKKYLELDDKLNIEINLLKSKTNYSKLRLIHFIGMSSIYGYLSVISTYPVLLTLLSTLYLVNTDDLKKIELDINNKKDLKKLEENKKDLLIIRKRLLKDIDLYFNNQLNYLDSLNYIEQDLSNVESKMLFK